MVTITNWRGGNGEGTEMTDSPGQYRMAVVSQISGLDPHTIRAWQRRYGAVAPSRSDGNTRLFSADDVARLTLLRELTERGHPIGTIAHLDTGELTALVRRPESLVAPAPLADAPTADPMIAFRAAYMGAVRRFDAGAAAAMLGKAATAMSSRAFVYEVVIPILQDTGVRWARGEIGIAHEHLVSAQMRGLITTLTSMHSARNPAPKLVAATPAGHRHEFGVMIGALLAATQGYDVVYVGPDLPEREIQWVLDACRPHILLLGVVTESSPDELKDLQQQLSRLAAQVTTYVGTPDFHPIAQLATGAVCFHRYETFEQAIATNHPSSPPPKM
ncbi:MAG: MerR family transcriptional regulator [Myxococcales bacterium]|nr:MerR family transcriptional regulator [Myxococcales bacterium]